MWGLTPPPRPRGGWGHTQNRLTAKNRACGDASHFPPAPQMRPWRSHREQGRQITGGGKQRAAPDLRQVNNTPSLRRWRKGGGRGREAARDRGLRFAHPRLYSAALSGLKAQKLQFSSKRWRKSCKKLKKSGAKVAFFFKKVAQKLQFWFCWRRVDLIKSLDCKKL